MIPNNKDAAFRITLIYVFFGAMWILFSDLAMEALFYSAPALGFAQTVKGWVFILFTGGMLYLLIGRRTRHLVDTARALGVSEKKFKAFFNSATVAISMVNTRGDYREVNPCWAEMVGYARQDLLTMNYVDITHPDDTILSSGNLEALAAGTIDGYRIEKRFLHKDGRPVWTDLSVTAHRDRDGNIEFILCMAVDITKRKSMETALQESQALFDSFMNHVPAMAFMKNRAGRYLFLNDAYRRSYGIDPEKRIGKTDEELWPPEISRELIKNDRKVWETGKAFQTTERIVFETGTKIAQVTKFPLMRDGKPYVLGGIAFDITDQVRVEEDKEKLEAQLLQARKMEAIGTLAGGIAHDFNNLLMGILGNASMMRMDLAPDHPLQERANHIEEYVQSGSELTRQLLGFARSGKYEVQPTDITELIRRSASLFGRTKKEIDLHTDLPPETWRVEVDRGQIEQVLFNLYVNAWQAMPAGGQLSLKTENMTLDQHQGRLRTLTPGRYVRVTVADTGVGMDENVRQRIFDPFFTTREMGRGTGMGLASAYGIAQNHHGTIEVESRVGHGTFFFVYLPASDRAVQKKETFESGPNRKGSGLIHLVDDEPMILDVGAAMLEQLGYTVQTFENGASFLEALESGDKKADLVILDMIMPGMGGGEVYDRIREANAPVRVLLSSGYSIDGQAQAILDRGCDGFIQKPFDIESLHKKIVELTGG